jgi:hypothetical protein
MEAYQLIPLSTKFFFIDHRYGLNNFAAVWPRDGLLHGGNDVDGAEGGGVHGGGDSLLPCLPQSCLQVISVTVYHAIDLSPPLSLLLCL